MFARRNSNQPSQPTQPTMVRQPSLVERFRASRRAARKERITELESELRRSQAEEADQIKELEARRQLAQQEQQLAERQRTLRSQIRESERRRFAATRTGEAFAAIRRGEERVERAVATGARATGRRIATGAQRLREDVRRLQKRSRRKGRSRRPTTEEFLFGESPRRVPRRRVSRAARNVETDITPFGANSSSGRRRSKRGREQTFADFLED